MLLPQLVEGIAIDVARPGSATSDIAWLTDDSRQVRPGSLFAAMTGSTHKGQDYVRDAVRYGAVAILAHRDVIEDIIPLVPDGVTLLAADEPRMALAQLAARFYAPQPDYVAAVTGTDGKTSVAHFTSSLWEWQGKKAASFGTVGVRGGNLPVELTDMAIANTTPGSVALHQLLQALARHGVQHVAMEASSHGLHQYRLDGVRLFSAAFTNLTQDHLDYHGTLEAYFEAKARLFKELLPKDGTAVINLEDALGEALIAACRERGIRHWGYGHIKGAELELVEWRPHVKGAEVVLNLFGTVYTTDVPLLGRFQVMNLLAALGMVAASGEPVDSLIGYLPKAEGVPGRMQRAVVTPQGAVVLVDYAHTPGALEQVLKAVRLHAENARVIAVFGCGGDRDPIKRPLMGEIAGRLADVAILTDDNPRTEDAASIRAAVKAGMGHAVAEVHDIGGRAEAIQAAVRMARAGDVVLIAGKGHEKEQIIGTVKHPFDDVQVARDAANAKEAALG
ncbi:UDP-N-acetylmuramoyl-L-alanyl-D-glutamate--2,6-diaminopimelate ligase [bacterium]|nr:UDP-N-acetylmuramoyl-L-alanyl-D-glutamate--2,6-diaminopimelate ligase [bacterium]